MTTATPLSVTVRRVVDASPTALYDLITDIPRMGEWSPETVSATWLEGHSTATPGARFAGSNRLRFLRWTTKPVVDIADRGVRFAFTVPGTGGPQWSYEFRAIDHGTEVVESMTQQTVSPAVLRWLQRRAGVTDRAEHLRAGMTRTLENLAAAAER